MAEEQSTYLAYMLRLWQVERDGQVAWWASLESPHTGERHGFTDMEGLFAFLGRQVGLGAGPGPECQPEERRK